MIFDMVIYVYLMCQKWIVFSTATKELPISFIYVLKNL